ncbi:MAG: hypothetical protein O7C75_19665 [Verrucomicrobia bacterium]|nr:hypothetical protein [Verrucomicrobiota bacterium]
MVKDPMESKDLAKDPEQESLLHSLEEELRSYLDPEAIDQKANDSKATLTESYGGLD